jgi:hypothetical protein
MPTSGGVLLDEVVGTSIAERRSTGVVMMSLVRLLGFRTLGCGCVTGHYREVATSREVTYVEEKGLNCEHSSHRRNHTVASARADFVSLAARAS